ncbi:MAG: hypothetical protein BGO68_03410 [Candidatus Amoebophilus sp. 36-38]|nr:MAG: hypothetical protein BGO68_03410 [Candidatus Amoebophilus sp. 36-38]
MCKKYSYLLLISFLFVLNLCSCGKESDDQSKKDDNGRKIGQTKISYKINLDDSKKVREEGNKIYYDVPVNTQVIITATVVGPEKVEVFWNMIFSEMSGSGPIETNTTWEYTANQPSCIEVSGQPSRTQQVNGVDLIVNEEKAFFIMWK